MQKSIRKYTFPYKRVLRSGQNKFDFDRHDKTMFLSVFSESEIDSLVQQGTSVVRENRECVRLDALVGSTCKLSIVNFFDFLTTNLLMFPSNRNNKFRLKDKLVAMPAWLRHSPLEQKIRDAVHLHGCLDSVQRVLSVRELANVVAVSVVLTDGTDNVLLVKRGTKVAVSSGRFAVACAGTVDKSDFVCSDPFANCANRELKEELGLSIDLECQELVISKQKLQPVVLFSGKVGGSFATVRDKMMAAEDFSAENEMLFSIPKRLIPAVVRKYQFTDVAAYQLAVTAGFRNSLSDRVRWLLCSLRSVEITDYSLTTG